MGDYADRYAARYGDSNQMIAESTLIELKSRAMLAEDIAEKARKVVETARLALKDKVSVVSFNAADFNDLIEAIERRDDQLANGPTILTVNTR